MNRFRSFLFAFVTAFWLITFVIQPASLAQEGNWKSGPIKSPALEGNLIGDAATRSYFVYLPPSYETSEKRYPSFYVLHGYGQGPGLFLVQTGFKSAMDNMIKDGEIGEMIAVLVDAGTFFGGSQYRSSVTIGDHETYITRDLVNHIDANYRTIVHRESRGITGFSMGGNGAMHLALKFPNVFSVTVGQASGGYTLDNDRFKQRALGTARADLKDGKGFFQLPWLAQSMIARAAVALPNPDNPPLFLDPIAEVVNGEARLIPEAWEKILTLALMHDLDSYVNQPIRLNGIKIVHGRADNLTPIEESQELSQAMTDLGIDHEFKEHDGGHAFLPEESFQFLSDNLSFELPPPPTSVQPRAKLATTWGQIKNTR